MSSLGGLKLICKQLTLADYRRRPRRICSCSLSPVFTKSAEMIWTLLELSCNNKWNDDEEEETPRILCVTKVRKKKTPHSSDHTRPGFRHVQGLKDLEDVTIFCNARLPRLIHLSHILSLCVNTEQIVTFPPPPRRDISNTHPTASCWTLVTKRLM